MPRQIDLTPQNLKVTNNPLDQIGVDPAQITKILNTLPKITLQMIEAWVNQMLGYIDQVTGLDLLDFAKQIETLLGITDDLATGLLGNIPLIGPFLNGLTGSSTTGGGGLGGLTTVFTDLFGILGNPGGLGTGSPTIPGVGSIPLFGPLFNQFITLFGGSGTGLGGLTNVFTDFTRLLGNPTGLGTGSTTLPGGIPLLQPLVNAISQGFGGGTGLNFASLQSLLAAIPGAQQLIDTFVNTFLGLSGMGAGINDLTRAIQSIPGVNIIGTLLPGITSNMGAGHISNVLPELLTNPTFDTANSIVGQGVWTWDGTQGPGSLMTSVFTDAGGVLRELFGNVIHVAPGQVLNISTSTKWGNSFSGGANSIALTVAQFAGNVLSSYSTIASIASPGSSGGWTLLSGAYTVPSGIDSIFVRPTVTSAATAGRVWFGGMSVKSASTNILSSLIPGLDASKITSGLFNISQITNLSTLLSGFGTGSSILSQLIGVIPGLTGGLSGLTGLGSIFTDMLGLLGSPSSLGSGSPTLPGIGSIPLLGGLLSGGLLNGSLVPALTINVRAPTGFTATGSTTGGTLAAGTRYYVATGTSSIGESLPCKEVNVVLTGSTSSVALSWNADAARVNTKIYAGNSAGGENKLLATVTGTSYTDTGAAGTSATPPTSNTSSQVPWAAPIDTIVNSLGLSGAGHTIDDLINVLTAIPANNVLGVAGISGMGSTMQGTWDQMWQAFSFLTGSNQPLSALASAAHGTASNANDSLTQAISNSGLLTGFLSSRSVAHGLDPTAVASYHLAQNSNTGLNATTTVAPMSLHVITQPTKFGNFETVATKTGTVSSFYLNIYKMDSSGNLNSVYNSSDLSSQLSTSIGWVRTGAIALGSQPAFNAGDIMAIESVVGAGSGSVALRSNATGIPNHPTATPKNFAATRNPSGNLTPTRITAAALSYSSNQPWHSATIVNVPAGWQPPEPTSYLAAGSYTYTIPAFAKVVGTMLDIWVVGSGGGGQANYGALINFTGGDAGTWASQTLVCGTDYPTTATTLTVVVGAAGAAAGAYWTNGNPGNISTITWTDPSSVNHTITGSGGAGGGTGSTSGYTGKSPGNSAALHGVTQFGGTAVGANAAGSPPGGGGGGAGPYQVGGNGADGGAWIVARQS